MDQWDSPGKPMIQRIAQNMVLAAALMALAPSESLEAAQTKTKEVVVEGVPLHFLESGSPSNQTVLMLHGARFSSKTWQELGTIDFLAEAGYHVIALDLPGYGNSRASSVPPNEFLAYAVSQLPGQRPVVVSPSMSGSFSLPFVAHHPEKVSGFVPVAPVAIGTYADELKGSPVKTLIFWGENDQVVPIGQARILASVLGSSKLVILPDAGHPCYLDQPTQFHEELLEFLKNFE